MIYTASHRVVGRPRTVADCDHPGCDESQYLPGDVGVHYWGTLMRDLGWVIGEQPTRTAPLEFTATCPAHAS